MDQDLPPPPQPAALTVQQEADLACLRLGLMLSNISRGAGGSDDGRRLVRIYLPRLQRTDDARDWVAFAAAPDHMPYGEFMTLRDRCMPPRRR